MHSGVFQRLQIALVSYAFFQVALESISIQSEIAPSVYIVIKVALDNIAFFKWTHRLFELI